MYKYKPDIRFTGAGYDEIDDSFGGLDDKLVRIVNDSAFNRLGKGALRNPSDIEVSPIATDKLAFIVRAWHETASPAGAIGRLHVQELVLRVRLDEENMFLTTEEDSSYLLTTREAFLVATIGGTAAFRSMILDPTREQ